MVSKWCCVIGSFLNNCWMFGDFGLVFCYYVFFILWKWSGCLRYICFFGDLKWFLNHVCMSAEGFLHVFCAILKWFLNGYVWRMVFDRFLYDFVWLLICFVWFLCDGVVSEWLLKDFFVMFMKFFVGCFNNLFDFVWWNGFWIMFESFLNDFLNPYAWWNGFEWFLNHVCVMELYELSMVLLS